LGGQQTGGNEQGVAGEKEADQQPGFGEDDRGEAHVSGPLHELLNVAETIEEFE
jgi:hypothetical protein